MANTSDGEERPNVERIAHDELRSFVERIERLEEEKKAIASDVKDVYGEAKGHGYDGKILRKVVALRKQDRDALTEEYAILDTYLNALGMGGIFG